MLPLFSPISMRRALEVKEVLVNLENIFQSLVCPRRTLVSPFQQPPALRAQPKTAN